MCGFVGYLGGDSSVCVKGGEAVLKQMANKIISRGPDDAGYWFHPDDQIGLGHRRLSIVDLSPAGHQPMHSASGRYVIAFNGEIYNHDKLRAELELECRELNWRGHSDTETLLACIEVWGIELALQRCIGMFAIALWDIQKKNLILARDRVGEKPLYYGWQSGTLLFGSELKALRLHPAFKTDIDRDALCLYMRHNYIPAPHSIFKGINKLTPGSYLTVSLRQRDPIVKVYWSGVGACAEGINNRLSGDATEVVDDLDLLLKDAVKQQMMADVPLGAFLSGGVDSSTIVALMQVQSNRPVKTFSIGFHEANYNEAEHAKAVAQHLGTDHTELYVTSKDCLDVIPRLPALYDEPFSDSSQIPTFLVSQMARQHVTVSLSGDGGDELFCGYPRYPGTVNIWNKLSMLPYPLKSFFSTLIKTLPVSSWNSILTPFGGIIPGLQSQKNKNIGDRLYKAADVMTNTSILNLYHNMASHWYDPASVVINGVEPSNHNITNIQLKDSLSDVERMMALDLLTYLPDDILCKVDRAAMGVSLETRVPLLDHRVIEYAWRLPMEYKIRDGQTKWALRQVLYNYVPKELIERPKMGFGVPIDSWLRGPLKGWAEDLLSEARLRRDGYFKHEPIRKKWKEHLSGQRNWQYHLWDVLMFNQWLENNK